MKTLLLSTLTALALAGSASACPVIQGRIANGAATMPEGLIPQCGAAYRAYTQNSDGRYWTELYVVDTEDTSELVQTLVGGIYARGYRSTGPAKETEGSTIFGYRNAATGKVLLVQLMVVGDQLFLAVAGN